MDEHDVVPKLSGPELRKKKLLEYLAAKGKLRPPNPKPYLRDNLIKPQTSVKSVASDVEKENQGLRPTRVKWATNKPQPFAGTTRRVLQTAHQFSATTNTAKECRKNPSHSAVTATTCLPTTTQAKICPHPAVPRKATTVTTVTAKICPRTAPQGNNGTSAPNHARTKHDASVQTNKYSDVNISSQTTACLITAAPARTHPNTTTQPKKCSNRVARPREGPISAAPTRTLLSKVVPAKSGPDKATTIREHSSLTAPTTVAPTKSIVIAPTKRDTRSNFSATVTKKPSSTLQNKTTVETGQHGPILNSTGSKPVISNKEPVTNKFKIHLHRRQTKIMQEFLLLRLAVQGRGGK
ncbi:salivary glue protein Sgs-3-like [Megalops cyprinoides]|uniref:salivary glue protein Sgs-3-like n=1 Tax=Megalops cyprinoides TaxID=118141 RepID=UPI0018654A7B|nr:salivary glue protein Sgs-3-like [Megalops cyprinoides]